MAKKSANKASHSARIPRTKPARNYIYTSLYLTPEQAETLRKLSEKTRIAQQVFLREAVDELLKKYRKELRA